MVIDGSLRIRSTPRVLARGEQIQRPRLLELLSSNVAIDRESPHFFARYRPRLTAPSRSNADLSQH